LVITYFRFSQHFFSSQYHQGLAFAIWYWHFVDVVWLGLYGCIYHYRHLLYKI
jgi:heme/copper-type cytochrome/quinol oxidase subunit 3